MIPEIDIEKKISTERFVEIFQTYKCALLINIIQNDEQKIIEQWLENVKEYFSQDTITKNKIPHDRYRNIGYQLMHRVSTPIERYHFYKNRMNDSDWDKVINKDLALQVVDIYERITVKMLQLFDLALDSNTQLVDAHKQAWNTTAVMHYHPVQENVEYTRGNPHYDWGTITFFWQLEKGGLEMNHADRTWHHVQEKENSVAVCIGKTLQRWSNDFFQSTLHRVHNNYLSSSRYSMPHFVVPQPGTVIKNLTQNKDIYPPITIEEFLPQISNNNVIIS